MEPNNFLSLDQINDNLIQNIFLKSLKLNVSKISHVEKGEANLVFKITTSSANFYLRISKMQDIDFLGESWAMERAASKGVPVAKILVLDNLEFENGKFQYSIQTEVLGKPLEEIFNEFESGGKIVNEAGKILSSIHSVSVDFCGKIARKDEERFTNYHDLLNQKFIKRPGAIEFIVGEIADKDYQDVELIKTIFDQEAQLFKGDKNVLSHKDFGPEHIFVYKDQVSGIIDWGECGGFTAIHDFAWWNYYFSQKYPIEELKKQYLNQNLFDQYFEKKLKLVELNIALDSIWWYDYISNKESLTYNVSKLQELIEFFR